MRTLLFGLIFGLLAVVHSSPITNVTQMPAKAEDEILQAVTDGFLVDFQGFTSESPKKNTTVSASQQTSTVSDEKDFEGSASGESGDLFPLHVGEHFTTTTTATTTTATDTTTTTTATTTSAASLGTSTVVTDFEGSASGESGAGFPFHEGEWFSTTPTTTTAASEQTSTVSGEKASEESASGESSDLHPLDEGHSTTSPTLPAPVGPRGSRMFGILEDLGSNSVKKDDKDVNINNEPQKGNTEMHKGHTTPGWIIIVAFIVGLAALIMICVAIATRDKWNRPNQAPTPENNTNSTNQQKEQEMETFLPKENGKSSEYTVIPLDELPEKYSSD